MDELAESWVFEPGTSDQDRKALLLAAVANLEACPSESWRAKGQQLREAIANGFRGGTRDVATEPPATGDAAIVEADGSRSAVWLADIREGVRRAHSLASKRRRGAARDRRSGARPRGAGRPKTRASSARRSSERSGDSGDSESESSEPPQAGRLCQLSGCGNQLPPARPKFCSDRHAALARKRRERSRDRANPERVADRGHKLVVERALSAGVSPHILCRVAEHHDRGFELHSPDDDVFCGLCGRWLRAPTALVNGYDATRGVMERLDERATGERRHESWQLPRRRREPPWPDRAYTDPAIVKAAA